MQSRYDRLFVAAAGAGKTTHIINESIAAVGQRILITTYTENNEQEIRNKFRQIHGYIPNNITIQKWCTFLLEHGVRPYQSILFEGRAAGIQLVNRQSASGTKDVMRTHYFNKNDEVYSDKLSKLVCKINESSNGLVVSRLERIFDCIYIDEVQDLSGYDLEFVKLLANSTVKMTLVGDPRQVTYHTHWEQKNKRYLDGKIIQFIIDNCKDMFEIDQNTLSKSYRNNAAICSFSSQLFSEFAPTQSAGKNKISDHEGIFVVHEKNVDDYLKQYQPIQLRHSSSRKVNKNYPVYTFGGSKGKTFERVLIYATIPMKDWLKNRNKKLEFQSRCKAYVAITRAVHSVAFVVNDNDRITASDICVYEPYALKFTYRNVL